MTVLPMFQSAPLLRGAMRGVAKADRQVVVSIRAPLARGDIGCHVSPDAPEVSIRAPLARGDRQAHTSGCTGVVSIRAPLARGDCEDRA